MSEKRFTQKDESIINTQTDELVNASSEESAKIIVSWLNELSDKKAELMKENYCLLDGLAYRDEVEIPKLSERISDLECENEQLRKENNKIKNILLNKKKVLEYDYNRAVRAGMPTGGTIGELDTIENILEEMGWKND